MKRNKGWRYESDRHSLAARGHRTKPWTGGRAREVGGMLRGELRGYLPVGDVNDGDVNDATDLAWKYLDANKDYDRAAMDADRDYMALKKDYERTGDPNIKHQMDMNKLAQKIMWRSV